MDSCSHIWDQVHQRTPRPTNPKYEYRCRKCEKEITSNDSIPCIHDWKDVSHTYGSNYRKQECVHCHQSGTTVYTRNWRD